MRLFRLEKDLCMSSDGRTMERAYEAAREKEASGAALIRKDDAYERYVTRALHKRFTVDLLLRGKRAMQTQQANSSMMQIDDHSDGEHITQYAHTVNHACRQIDDAVRIEDAHTAVRAHDGAASLQRADLLLRVRQDTVGRGRAHGTQVRPL